VLQLESNGPALFVASRALESATNALKCDPSADLRRKIDDLADVEGGTESSTYQDRATAMVAPAWLYLEGLFEPDGELQDMHEILHAASVFDPTNVVGLHGDADFVLRAQLEVFIELLGQQLIDGLCDTWLLLVKYVRR
jgi:hypothetical protein